MLERSRKMWAGERKRTTLFCFSPPVMLATMLIEFGGAIYCFVRYRASRTVKLVIAVLIFLGIFQGAEFMICDGETLSWVPWARIGFAAITMLPPLGISLAMSIAGVRGKEAKWAQVAMYSVAAGFIGYYLFWPSVFSAEVCAGNYVIFEAYRSQVLYGVYYYVLLLIGVVVSILWAGRAKDKDVRSALRWLAIGYGSFIIPTAVVNMIDRETLAAIPSIMCGFAVVLALILIFVIVPKVGEKRVGCGNEGCDIRRGKKRGEKK